MSRPRAGRGPVPRRPFPRGAARLCRAGMDGEPSVWPGRRRFPAPRWPWARLRNETPCTTPQPSELPLTPPRRIKPRHAAARPDPGEPVEQVSGPSATAGWGSVPGGGPATPPASTLGSAKTCSWSRGASTAGTCPGSSPHPRAPSSPCARSRHRRRGNFPSSREPSLAFFPRQLPETPSERTAPPLLPPRTYRPGEEQHGPVQLPQEAQGP